MKQSKHEKPDAMSLMKGFIPFLIIIGMVETVEVQAQDVLTLEEAIARGLENNHGILIARNRAEIDAVNRSPGGAGFLPSIQLSGTHLETDDILREDMAGESRRDEITTDFLSVDVALDWTFFDGLKMFTTYNKLTELRALGQTEARIRIENTIAEIIDAYYDIVRQRKLLGVLENSIEMSEERVSIAETKQELGSGSEYEILLAQADLNADHAAVIRQEVTVNNAGLRLLQLLDMGGDSGFAVEETIELNEELGFEELYTAFTEYNPEVKAANMRASVSRLELNEIRAERFPELELNLGYGAFREEAVNDIILLEEQAGFRFGITARFNLFDGFSTNRRAQIARINWRTSNIIVDESTRQLETLLQSEYMNYTSAYKLVELEEENLDLALRALEIGFERFRLATITSIELRETQRILLDTEDRLINAQFQAKISEAELLRISGLLSRDLVL